VRNDVYVRLGQRFFEFFQRMNGEDRIEDIAERLFGHREEIDWGLIFQFLSILQRKRMLLAKSSEDEVVLEKYFAEPKETSRYFLCKIGSRFIKTRIAFNGADKYITRLYDAFGKVFFRKISVVLISLVSLVGISLLTFHLRTDHISMTDLLTWKGSYVFGLPLIYVGALAVMILHECGHALTCKYFGRKVGAMGFMLYCGFPCFFTDVTDAWMLPKRKQVLVDGAGVIVNVFVGAVFSIIAFLFSSSAMNAICIKASILNFMAVVLNLVPFLKYDGYYIISDLLDEPNLREEALRLLLNLDCWRKTLRGSSCRGENQVIFFFGLCCLVYTVATVLLALHVLFSLIHRNLPSPYNVFLAYLVICTIGFSLIWLFAAKVKSNLDQSRRTSNTWTR
jgi:putative peptide zinc metalloprotease protein